LVKHLLVVGGGAGGTMVANLLTRNLRQEIKDGLADVTLLSESYTHAFQPDYLHVAFKGKDPRIIVRNERTLLKREVRYAQEVAEKIDLNNRTVATSKQELPYDYLIIATGSKVHPDAIPGLGEASMNFHVSPEESQRIWTALNSFREGKIVIDIATFTYKCSPSPNEAAFLCDEFFRRRGTRDKVELTFVTPFGSVYPSDEMSKVVDPLFEKRNIETIKFFDLDSVDPKKREIRSSGGDAVKYDLLIAIPPHRGDAAIFNSQLGDDEGWVPTDKSTMRVRGYDDAFAIGDATDIPLPKAGVVAHLQAEVVALNIASSIKGLGATYKYDGRINCPFEMGFGKASFVISDFKRSVRPIQPTRFRYIKKIGGVQL